MAQNVVPVPAGVDPVELLRRYEPVIRFTEGELFFPMAVDAYVEQAALWGRAAGEGERKRLVDHGELDLDVLCTHARTAVGTTLELHYVPAALTPGELRQWRRDPNRPRFRSTSRFAAVGLLGRIIDSLFRLSLILRGSVPGGLTAALHRRYSSSAAATNFPYYAHHAHDPFAACQQLFGEVTAEAAADSGDQPNTLCHNAFLLPAGGQRAAVMSLTALSR